MLQTKIAYTRINQSRLSMALVFIISYISKKIFNFDNLEMKFFDPFLQTIL